LKSSKSSPIKTSSSVCGWGYNGLNQA